MLSQHFSTHIFREETLDSTFLWDVSSIFSNILHKNVDQHFLKMLQHFSGKNQHFFSSSNFGPSSSTASSAFTSGRRREPGHDVAELAGRQHVGDRAQFVFISPDGHLPN
jgi:hypothetical protein